MKRASLFRARLTCPWGRGSKLNCLPLALSGYCIFHLNFPLSVKIYLNIRLTYLFTAGLFELLSWIKLVTVGESIWVSLQHQSFSFNFVQWAHKLKHSYMHIFWILIVCISKSFTLSVAGLMQSISLLFRACEDLGFTIIISYNNNSQAIPFSADI